MRGGFICFMRDCCMPMGRCATTAARCVLPFDTSLRGSGFCTARFRPRGDNSINRIVLDGFLGLWYGVVRLVPTVSVVSKGYMHLARNSCGAGGICGRSPLRMTGVFRSRNVEHLRIMSLSKTQRKQVVGCHVLRQLTAHASLVVSFKNKLGRRKSLRVTFRDNTRVIANKDVTIGGPRVFAS